MSNELKVSIGQHSDKGRKEINQDFHGALIPKDGQLRSKGIVVALADGISSSDVSHIASESAIKGFIEDYYCTSESWTVKTSAQRVLIATNSWLFSQTQRSPYRYEQDRGYVCTLSALILKSTTAHLFHVGDARIYRLRDNSLEQLSNDHRVFVSAEQSYLGRALGVKPQLEIDYQTQLLEQGDIFVLLTDGVYEFLTDEVIVRTIAEHADDIDKAASRLVDQAYERGSTDNLTAQIVRIDALPVAQTSEITQQRTELPLPPILAARAEFDGYRIMREIHGSARSHIYLAQDLDSDAVVVLKTPAVDMQQDPAHLERFLMEEWVARRIDSPHVLKPCPPTRKRNYLYVTMEYVEGRTLTQWMRDNPRADVETVRGIAEQVAAGLQAFHRLEMLHQDLRPDNIMIDTTGTVKIIDFGSVSVSGLLESAPSEERGSILGTVQYTAPEYFLGDGGTPRSDLFSLGVIVYQMLSGELPYGAEAAKARTKSAQNKLNYRSVLDEEREIPVWLDGALRKAVHPDPYKRYGELSEFIYDLRHPNAAFVSRNRPPLLERNPLLFWKSVTVGLGVMLVVLSAMLALK
jgi:serine/threonine protein phosphatase PrpC/tRNA A-37 threonylcarbamoyl transferase component Bud32